MFVLELFNTSGTKVAQMDKSECTVKIRRVLNGEYTINIIYPIPPTENYGEDKSQYLTAWNYKARITNLDDSTDIQTFIITKTNKQRKPNGSYDIVAQGESEAVRELLTEVINDTIDIKNFTPTEALTEILDYSANWSEGTVSASLPDKVSFYVSYETVMSALQKLLIACTGEYDIDETNNEIDISASLGSNNYVNIRPGKNLQSIRNTQYFREVINKMYGVGGGQPPATIKGARHIVNTYDSGAGVVTVDDNKVVVEDDSWNTNYKIKFVTGSEAGNSFAISDCTAGATNDTIKIDTGLSLSAGDKFIIIDAGPGNEIDYIRAGNSIANYGTVEGVLKDERFIDNTNLVTTPALDGTYAAGLCQDWTKQGTPTVTELAELAYIQYGTKSQVVESSAAGEGISQNVIVTSGTYFRATVWVYVFSGDVLFQVSDGTSTWQIANDEIGWQRFTLSEKSVSDTLDLRILVNSAVSTQYSVDAVQITEGVLERSFTVNSDSKSLHDRTYDRIVDTKDPRVEYVANFIDLHRMNPQDFPFDKINLGDTLTIIDEALGISDATARVRKLEYEPFRPETAKHTVSNII